MGTECVQEAAQMKQRRLEIEGKLTKHNERRECTVNDHDESHATFLVALTGLANKRECSWLRA